MSSSQTNQSINVQQGKKNIVQQGNKQKTSTPGHVQQANKNVVHQSQKQKTSTPGHVQQGKKNIVQQGNKQKTSTPEHVQQGNKNVHQSQKQKTSTPGHVQQGNKNVVQQGNKNVHQSQKQKTSTPVSDGMQKLVKKNLEDFLDLFVLVKFAVLYYTYGVLDPTSIKPVNDRNDDLYEEFKNLLVGLTKETDTPTLTMIDNNPLLWVNLTDEMMDFILKQMLDQRFCRGLYTKIIHGIYLNPNTNKKYKSVFNQNKEGLTEFKRYVDTFCYSKHSININIKEGSSLYEEMEKTFTEKTTLQDLQRFGNRIAKQIWDNSKTAFGQTPQMKDNANDNATPQMKVNANDSAKPLTSMDKLKRQTNAAIERLMELLHLHKGETHSNLH